MDGGAGAAARRLVRWLSLTLIHQGAWPLLVVVFGAPAGGAATTPGLWYLGRLGGPLLAAALAAAVLAQFDRAGAARGEVGGPAAAGRGASGGGGSAVRGRARLALFGLAAALAVGRVAAGPSGPVAKLLLFGAVDVAAFQLIHFGVVARSFPAAEGDRAQGAAVLLFGASWGLRDAAVAGIGGGGDLVLRFGAGLLVGAGVALLSRGLRRWPGGALAGAAGHWLVVYLVLGFAR